MKQNGRSAALYALGLCRREGAWPDEALAKACRGLDSRETAFCTRLVFTVLQNRLLIDAYLTQSCRRPLHKLEPLVLDALRVGVCQLKLLDKIPDSAAISETVELVRKRVGQHVTGFCNGVLRAVSRATESVVPEGNTAETLSVRYSHPLWLTERFVACFGEEGTEKLLALNNTPPELTIHCNPYKTTPEELRAELRKLGAAAELFPGVAGCLVVKGLRALTETAIWREGHFLIADPAARLIADVLAPLPGEEILDCCAAPGGKSFLLAFMLEGKGKITALDLHPHKIKLLEAGAKRLGVTELVSPQWGDATGLPPTKSYDRILADVPCSGMGVIRKKPDIRYKNPEELGALPSLQGQILHSVAGTLRPGGTLVYSTCTLLPEENEGVIEAFMKENPAFSLDHSVTLFPPDSLTDGFYYAKLYH